MKKNVTNADGITFTVKDNSGEVISELESKLPTALEACGLLAERFAKQICTESHIVDTGLLRNSITYAIAGKAPAITSYKADKPNKNGEIVEGQYKGKAPTNGGKSAVFIGSNVEYAIPVEFGHALPSGAHVAPRPFLKPAIENHIDEYKAVLKKYLGK